MGQLFETSIKELIKDRIASTQPPSKCQKGLSNLSIQFRTIVNSLHKQIIKYKESINNGAVIDNDYFITIQGLVKDIFNLSEVAKIYDLCLYDKSRKIVNKYNLFIEALRKQFSSKAQSQEYQQNAMKSSEQFHDFEMSVIKELYD